jgi:glycosyltransferase involved in cell wall biosynthesis
LPNSVDGSKFCIKEKSKELIDKFDLSDSKIILTICRLSFSEVDNKGYERVVRTMPEIIKHIPSAKYLLVGGGDDEKRIKSIIKELGLENNVIMPGQAKDEEMVDYYNLADVFAYPSKKEGFPAIVLLEALACGKPVIGGNQNDSDSFKDVGLIIDPDNRHELSGAIINVLSGNIAPEIKNSQTLRRKVLKRYGLEVYRFKVMEFLEALKS